MLLYVPTSHERQKVATVELVVPIEYLPCGQTLQKLFPEEYDELILPGGHLRHVVEPSLLE
jgi:hypothetical protein